MSSSNNEEDEKPKILMEKENFKTNFFVYLFYMFMATVAVSYCVYLYDPSEFRHQSVKLKGLQPLLTFFEMVEKYSPFHEFLLDDVDAQIAMAKATNGKKNQKNRKGKKRIFTVSELKEYDGSISGKGPFLALLGKVYDVSKGMDHYGPGGGYAFFSGKDGSRAFVTGEFNDKGLTDDVTGLTHQDYLGLEDWGAFYKKDYKQVGILEGRYYDNEGRPTAYHSQLKEWIAAAKAEKEKRKTESERFPPCNSKWSKKEGHLIWCSKKSGGIERSWVGVPRRLFTPGQPERCACIKNFGEPEIPSDDVDSRNRGDLDHPHLKEYPNCDSKKYECLLEPPEPKSESDYDVDHLFDDIGAPSHNEL